ncbi:Zn-ribbon domain-containing protein [Candidatus Woesearchaeota archaeon]|nr:Zn-ribbon domain-containing protein [Candidatus Woesearchaeota archaeon]
MKIPHQCVKCGKLHGDASSAILEGCSDCGSKLFFYVRKDAIEKAKKRTFDLTSQEKEQMEKDVYEIIGSDIDSDLPVVLDIESINILKPGKYELDLVNLFKKKQPLIYKLEDGKYIVDVIESFKKIRE